MQHLNVSYQEAGDEAINLEAIAAAIKKAGRHPLSFAPWSNAYPYTPVVDFSIAFGQHALFLQFSVAEKMVRATHGKTNEPVYEDSCVEFFVSFDEGSGYYNFEFNCIGTVLAGYGTGKNNRTPVPDAVLDSVLFHTVIGKEKREELVHWQLTIVLPLEVFAFHTLSSLRGRQCRANFYKCGDHLPEPHFLSWAPIESKDPNFHLPGFFGTLCFEQ